MSDDNEAINDTDERRMQAQVVIDTALMRARSMGYGVVADGTVHGNGIWLGTLRVVRAADNKKD